MIDIYYTLLKILNNNISNIHVVSKSLLCIRCIYEIYSDHIIFQNEPTNQIITPPNIIITEIVMNNYLQILKDNLSDQINIFVIEILTLFLSLLPNNNLIKANEIIQILNYHHIINYYNIESFNYRHILLSFYNQILLSNIIPFNLWNNNYIDNIIYIFINIESIDKDKLNNYIDTIIFMKIFVITFGKEGIQYLFSIDHSRINIYYQMLILMEKLLIEINSNKPYKNELLLLFSESFVFMNIISTFVSLENHLKEFGSYSLAVVVVGKFIRIIQSMKEYDKIKYNAQSLLDILNSKS